MPRITELAYQPDSSLWFRNLLDRPYCVFLDSGFGSPFAARYDILAADPWLTLRTAGEQSEIRSEGTARFSADDPLSLLNEVMGPLDPGTSELPFTGGAIGCFSYDLGRRFERLPTFAERDIEFPDLSIGLYDWAYVVDHQERRSFLVSSGRDPRTRDRWPALIRLAEEAASGRRQAFEVVSPVEANFTRAGYGKAFAAVQEHIRRGDCYQVNLAQRFSARVRGDSWNAYVALRSINPAPFSAYLSTPDGDILSSSPERFLRLNGDRVETKPIKGTRARGADEVADARKRAELAESFKDRAENVMIVDLLRNDLGKVCMPGSVRVSKLFDIETFAQVHHMVSTVSGRLAPECHPLDLVRACFPGGSITGAPKVRSMEIIDALEPQRRGIYCGSIGYIGHNGRMDLNIAIRSLLRVGDTVYAWAGGGIVADSSCESEYQESLDKASGLLTVLSDSSISAVS